MASRTIFGYSRKFGAGLVGVGVALSALLAGCASEQLVPLGPTDNGEAKRSEAGVQVRAEVERPREYVPSSLTPRLPSAP